MKLVATEKDKQNNPVAIVDISNEEIAAIKKAAGVHPKFKAQEELEGIRMRELFYRPPEEWRKLRNINITDIKEVVNWFIQNGGENGMYGKLRDELHQIWKEFNPS